MVRPPVEVGGIHESTIPPSPGIIDVSTGALGTDEGVAVIELLDRPVLMALTAAINIVYPVPLTSEPPVERAVIVAVVPDVPNVI